MAQQTEAEKKAAAEAAKKIVVPKEMRERLSGKEPTPESPEDKAKREALEKAAKDKTDLEAKEKKDREDEAAEKKKKKDQKSDLPPIPAAAPAPGITAEEVKKIVDESKAPRAQTPALSPEDQADLELAQFAAKQYADRYSDLPKRITEWVGRRDEFLTAKAKELGGRDSVEFRDFVSGDEYQKFVRQNIPSYQRGDAKKLHDEYQQELGAQRTMQKIKPELDELKQKQRQIEMGPVIQQTVGQGVRVMLEDTDASPDEALVDFSKNPTGFLQENEIEGGIIVRHANFFKDAMEETLRVTSGLVTAAQLMNPTPTQKWIDQFIVRKEQEIEAKFPNGAPSADGSIIVSAAQMDRLKAARPANLASYRQMLPAEIVGAMAVEGRLEIKRQLGLERQKLERSGFQRVKKAETKPKDEKPAPSRAEESPMAGASASRGAGGGSPGKVEPYWAKYVNGTG